MSTSSGEGADPAVAAAPGWDGEALSQLVNQFYADHPRAAAMVDALADGVAGLAPIPGDISGSGSCLREPLSAPGGTTPSSGRTTQQPQPPPLAPLPTPWGSERPHLTGYFDTVALSALGTGLPAQAPLLGSAACTSEHGSWTPHSVLTESRHAETPARNTTDFYFLRQGTAPRPGPAGGFDVWAVRREFPALGQRVRGRPLIWMDNAATTQKPQCVIDAVAQFYARDNSNIHRGAHALAARATQAYEGAREKVRAFLGASHTQEIIFLRGTTEAINLVAQSWGGANVGPGDEILLTTMEHHANIVPWQMLCERVGARLRVAPIDDRGEVILARYAALLGSRTKMVAITQVSNVLGTVNPVEVMTRMAHAVGAKVLIDGAQSVPHFPVDVQALDCDFFVFSGHKLFGPTGIGVLYGKVDLLEAMPPWQGGGMMIADVTFEKTTYNRLPYKFEAGTNHIAGAVGLGAAIDFLGRIDFQAAAAQEHAALAYAMTALAQIPGLRLIGTSPTKVSTLSFVLEGIANEAVGRHLDRCGIAVRASHHCAQPTLRRYGLETSVRPSLAFYNTSDEVDVLVAAIRQLVR